MEKSNIMLDVPRRTTLYDTSILRNVKPLSEKAKFRKQIENKKKNIGLKDVPNGDILDDELLMTHGIKYCDDYQQSTDSNGKQRYLKEKRHVINIDSSRRRLVDTTIQNGVIYNELTQTHDPVYETLIGYPEPNSYTFHFGKTYQNIKSIRLISTIIPNTDRVINNNNNDITFKMAYGDDDGADEDDLLTDGIDSYNIIVPLGNYTATELAQKIKSLANTAIKNAIGSTIEIDILNVTFDTKTGIFEISILTNPSVTKTLYFSWDFIPNTSNDDKSLHNLLGFQYHSTEASGNEYVTSFSNEVDLGGGKTTIYRTVRLLTEEYIFLCIDGLGTVDDIGNISTQIRDNIFAKLLLNVGAGSYAFDTFTSNTMIFDDTTLKNLDKFKISFVRPSGELYDFYGLDHSMSFEFIEYGDYLIDAHYDSSRGVNDRTSFI